MPDMKLAALLLFASCAAAAEPAARKAGDGAPVVYELFTSQGCSSCPPAERVLSAIAADGSIRGRRVVPLAFHVDYWNDLGWADPWSSEAWSARQQQYTRRPYTPQAVIAGTTDALGSDRDAIARAVADAPAMIAIDAKAARARDTLRVTATAPKDADVWVAIWQDGLATDIGRGENAGAHVVEDRIVRALVEVAPAGATRTTDLKIDPKWKRIGAVAFAQRPDRAIIGATVLDLSAPRSP
jgi:hypothetical protein